MKCLQADYRTRKELNEKYKIQEKGLNHITDDVKQRVKAKALKIHRYTNMNKGYLQNKINQLRGEDAQQENP